jgi:hypothetical protein
MMRLISLLFIFFIPIYIYLSKTVGSFKAYNRHLPPYIDGYGRIKFINIRKE